MKKLRWLITSSLSLAISIALLLVLSGGVQALMVEMSLEELTAGADSIVVGTVISTSSQWNADHTKIYTEVVVSVEDTLKGAEGNATITIIVPGGIVDDRFQWVEDTPVFEAGEKVGLFLEELNSASFAQMGMGGMTQMLAANPPSRVYGGFQGRLPLTEGKAGILSTMSVDNFKQNVNLALAGEPVPEGQGLPVMTEGTVYQTISNISPNIASAGTNTMVTVTGNGFGTRGANDELDFYFATSGGLDYVMTSQIVSWSNTQIQAYVPWGLIGSPAYPYSAASGPVVVEKNGAFYSPTPFTVTFGYGQYKWPGTSPTMPYWVNEGGVSGRLAAVQAAANSWSNAGANFSFSYVGPTATSTKTINTYNEMLWEDLPNGVVASCSWDGPWVSGSNIIECDIAFNTDYTWSTGSTCPAGQYDVQSIATHELGHALCLLDLYGPSLTFPTTNDAAKAMYGYASQGSTTKRTLHAHDILGIKWIYPTSAPTVTNSTGASSITSASARLNGNVTSTGGENPTVTVYYGITNGGTTPGNWASNVNLGAKSSGTFYTDVQNLTPNTPYYYRCYATNSAGSDWADSSAQFTTLVQTQRLIGIALDAASTGSAGGCTNVMVQRFQATASGDITEFKVKVSGNGNVKVAVYDDSSNSPGALRRANNSSTEVKPGWNTVSITPSVTVNSGNYYWLAVVSNSCNLYYHTNDPSANVKWQSSTYASWTYPDPAGPSWNTQTGVTYLIGAWGTITPPPPPTVTNSTGASNIASTTARLNGEVTLTGGENPTVIVYYGTTNGGTTPGNWTNNVNLGAKPLGTFYTDVPNLNSNTTYYYRCFAQNSGGSNWSTTSAQFTTLVQTQRLIGIASDTASTGGGGGCTNVMVQRFQATASGDVTEIRLKVSGNGHVKVAIYDDSSGSPGALRRANNSSQEVRPEWNWNTIPITPSVAVNAGNYYWLAVVSDSCNLYYHSNDTSANTIWKSSTYSSWTYPDPAGSGWNTQPGYTYFIGAYGTTIPPTVPTITNYTGASNIASTTARLNGEVTDNGNENPTVTVYYGTTNGDITPGNWASNVNLGAKPLGTFYTDVPSLTPNTHYFYRCFAQNSGGSDWADSSAEFTTLVQTQRLIGVALDAASTGSAGGCTNVMVQRFQATASGDVTEIRLKVSGNGHVKVAIYDDSSGSPGALRRANNSSQEVRPEWNWNTIPITPSVAVNAGTYYWLAVVSDSCNLYYHSNNPSANTIWKPSTYSSWTYPDPAGTGWNTQPGYTYLICAYGTPPIPPSTPALLSPTPITFRWGAVTGATKYDLEVNVASDFSSTFVWDEEVGNVISKEVVGLNLGTNYYWRVRAGNDAGWSSWSAVRSTRIDAVP